MHEPRGQWLRKPTDGTAAVFVHGILSSGEACWRNGDAYWPDLLASEEALSEMGIYLFSYRTGVFSASYSIGDAVEALHAYLQLDGLLDLRKLVFVCHSMGGIVVRQLLVTRQAGLIEKGIRVGLFLVASPSLGSSYANLFSALARAFGHAQGDALRFAEDNLWLNDLDRNFMNLKESRRLALQGQELVEDRFVVLPRLLRDKVVEAFSGTRYFGESIKIPGSDHFTIAKPADRSALQHRLLVRFIGAVRNGGEEPSAAGGRIRLRRVAPGAEERHDFDGRHVTLGRGPGNDLVVDDPQVSWEHGVIALERGVFVYRHLSRTNPTEVRGRGRQVRLAPDGPQETILVDQDRIAIGAVTLVVELAAGGDDGYVTTAKAQERLQP